MKLASKWELWLERLGVLVLFLILLIFSVWYRLGIYD